MQKWRRVIVICCICVVLAIFLVKSWDYMQTLYYDEESEEQYNVRRAGKIVDATVEYLSESKDIDFKGVDNLGKAAIAQNIYSGQEGARVYVIDPVVLQEQILVESKGEIFGPYLDFSPQLDEGLNYYIVVIKENDLVIKAIVAKEQDFSWDSENHKIIGAIEEFENVTEVISK